MKRLVFLLILILTPPYVLADWLNRGYVKYGFTYVNFPEHSFASLVDENQTYQHFSTRLMSEKSWQSLSVAMHYDLQYQFAHQDTLNSSANADSGNLFDMTAFMIDDPNQNLMHRFDRLYVHYRGQSVSVKAGRQALTWGHGLMFQVMDIFNPFSPIALDTDYKSGNDMLYAEWLLPHGDDVQALYVPRENTNDDLALDASAFAAKYHGFYANSDVDFLVARNNDVELFAFGIARPIKESVWRLDLVVHHQGDNEFEFSAVTNVDYSWVWYERNVYGFLEYLYDSKGGREQGGLYLQDHHYVAASLRIELHPLINISPSVISNIKDNSGLFYATLYYDWMQDLALSTSFVFPYGDDEAEFSGPLTPGKSIRLLLSAYF